jgi:hypothetical protein
VAVGELFGRRIRVTVGNSVLCDLRPDADQETNEGRNLDVEFTTEKHTKLEPQATSVTVWGLTRDDRLLLKTELDAANQIAWQTRRQVQAGQVDILEGQEQAALESLIVNGAEVKIEAGYGNDFGLLNVAQILPGGLKFSRDGPGWKVEISAQDTRFLWQNGFVSQTIAGGVSLYDYQAVIDASEAVQAGEAPLAAFTEAFPNLTQIKDIPGHKNGFVLHGQAQRNRRQLSEVLGLRPFLDEFGNLIYLNPIQTRAGLAIRLAPSSGLLDAQEQDRGMYTAVSLLNYRIQPGRQVLLFEDSPDSPNPDIPIEIPVGAGTFRVDYVKHSGASHNQSYYSEISLRPTTLSPAANP